ncbi:MAG: POT family proton-dependent oligopeptide transporter [Limisphaerales bacterium]|jgi:POT family proton-dependent oligopeptide transporter
MGHPRGLVILFFAEMWERFSFYGMRGLLVLYLTKHWLFSDGEASGIYAGYASLVYLMPVIGGLVADRYLGFKKAVVIGACLLCLGHLGMAFEGDAASIDAAGRIGAELVRDDTALQVFYLSLALIIVGVGLLKPSISSIVGELYGKNDPRRDGGFTIFYMGINVGAVLAALTCGYVGEVYGWSYGFGLAGIGMLIGLLTFIGGAGWLEGKGETPSPSPDKMMQWIYLGITSFVVLCWWLMQHQQIVGGLLSVASILVIVGVLAFMFTACSVEERKGMGLLLFLTAYSVIFWALFEQAGSSMNLFADRNVEKELLGLTVTASQLQFFNPGFIVLLAPLFSMLWMWLGQRGMEPSSSVKFGLGVTQAGLGFFLLVYGIEQANSNGQVAMLWLALAYLVHTSGELCISPVGLSMVTKLAVPKVVGLMMGVWFLASSVAHYVAGMIATLASVDKGAVGNAQASLVVYQETFYLVGVIGVVAGLVLLALAPLISRWVR